MASFVIEGGHRLLTDVHAKAIGILHHATTVSVAELLTQVEIEI